jgi:hypothetical protein
MPVGIGYTGAPAAVLAGWRNIGRCDHLNLQRLPNNCGSRHQPGNVSRTFV